MVYLFHMEIQKIGTLGKMIQTEKRKRYGIKLPNCFACYHNGNNSAKRIRKGNLIIKFNGNTYYICKYCYSHKRKLKRILSQLS